MLLVGFVNLFKGKAYQENGILLDIMRQCMGVDYEKQSVEMGQLEESYNGIERLVELYEEEKYVAVHPDSQRLIVEKTQWKEVHFEMSQEELEMIKASKKLRNKKADEKVIEETQDLGNKESKKTCNEKEEQQ